MRLRITPRDTSFFDLLAELASHLVVGSQLLGEILGASKADRKAIGKKSAKLKTPPMTSRTPSCGN